MAKLFSTNRRLVQLLALALPLAMTYNATKTANRYLMEIHEDVEAAVSLPFQQQQHQESVHVMFALNGKNPFFFDEWEVALKSVLLNAPLDAPLHIHILANNMAHRTVKRRLDQNDLIGSQWRNPVIITNYNVEARHEEFRQELEKAFRGNATLDTRVSLGGYYRLFASRIIPPETGPVLYMDGVYAAVLMFACVTFSCPFNRHRIREPHNHQCCRYYSKVDTVVMANLGNLWQSVNRTYTFQASATWFCSAFMIINMEKAGTFWSLLNQVPNIGERQGGDQNLLELVKSENPEIFGSIPKEWDIHLGHGFRGDPHLIKTEREEGIGMLHFNGARPNFFKQGLMQYCDRTKSCSRVEDNKKIFRETWMLAEYYIRLPWKWVNFMRQSMVVGNGGYPLRYESVVTKSRPAVNHQDQIYGGRKWVRKDRGKHTAGKSTQLRR